MLTQVGRYRLIRAIGRGGMGEVHLARYEALPGVAKLAAVKLLRTDARTNQARLLDEARVMAHLSHPNVVQLLDAGIEGDVPWLALEFVAGKDLRRIVDAARAAAVPVSPWVYARIVADACAGLHAVHEARDERGRPLGIVHRDVSPQNVLVTWDGVVKLADFGVARSAIQSARTTTGIVKGKLGYMAPEQVRASHVDRRTDVFAMGVVLWEALAGRRLFAGDDEAATLARVARGDVPPLATAAPHAPAALAPIAARALAADPSARFWTALEMKQAIEEASARAGVLVRETEVAETLATVLPEHVREHEGWLSGDATETSPLRADMTAPITYTISDATAAAMHTIAAATDLARAQATAVAPVPATALLPPTRGRAPTGPPPPFAPNTGPPPFVAPAAPAGPRGLAVAVVVAAVVVLVAFGALVVLVLVRK